MKDFFNSLEKAMLSQRWVFDDRWSRIGNPFSWVDGSRMDGHSFLKQEYAILQCLSMYYEEYESPEVLKKSKQHDECFNSLNETLEKVVSHFFPSLEIDKRIKNNIKCTALARTQDFSFNELFLSELPNKPVHLDIGPGLGTHAIYSNKILNSSYIALEANDYMYAVQRLIYRYLSHATNPYYDLINAETLGVSESKIKEHLSSIEKYAFFHLPSWHFSMLGDKSVDLATATFVLNEVSPAGIVWLLHNTVRCLKNGGYFYIRDSNKLKPNRHTFNYDNVLQDLGFKLVKKLDVINREDMFGIPRAYQKNEEYNLSFEDLFDQYFGRVAVTNHGGEYMQNLPKKLKA